MTTGQSSGSSRTKEPSATDHQEIERQFDAGELESIEGWLDQHNSGSSGLIVPPESTVETTTGEKRVPRGVAFTMGVYAERSTREVKDLRSVVPDSKPFRTLTKGKKWKKFEKVLESRRG